MSVEDSPWSLLPDGSEGSRSLISSVSVFSRAYRWFPHYWNKSCRHEDSLQHLGTPSWSCLQACQISSFLPVDSLNCSHLPLWCFCGRNPISCCVHIKKSSVNLQLNFIIQSKPPHASLYTTRNLCLIFQQQPASCCVRWGSLPKVIQPGSGNL